MQSAELVQEWAARINMIIRTETQRPTNLLVIVNPFGGARKAGQIWRKKAQPVFLLAGVLLSGSFHAPAAIHRPQDLAFFGSKPLQCAICSMCFARNSAARL